MMTVHLLTLDPGHFHAALVQKEMYEGVDARVHVYAPLGGDLVAHLQRIVGFNTRGEQPTAWQLEAHAGPDYLERAVAEKPGNVVILSGRNARKIDYLEAAVEAGLHVLADKPWIIRAEDLPRLERVLDAAEARGLIAYDIMTERYEITSILQRILVNDRDVFGEIDPGTPEDAGVQMESVHHLMKLVAGTALRRPAWFFDVTQQGEGLTDVGTHLVDLAQWILRPGRPIDYRSDIEVHSGRRWPTRITRENFQRITGEGDFPPYLTPALDNGTLDYFCNTQVCYSLCGVWVTLNVLWAWEAEPGTGDTHFAIFRGTRARVDIHQGPEQHFVPEVYVAPRQEGERDAVYRALERRVEALHKVYPGLGLELGDERARVVIPDTYRIGHEAHFAEVTRKFLGFLVRPELMPSWEKPGMLAKYHVTTTGVQLAQGLA